MFSYTPSQVIDRLEQIGGLTISDRYTLVGIQSQADAFNRFDDLFYLFYGDSLKVQTTGTTNAGKNALLNFEKEGLSGAAVWKTDEYYQDLFIPGLHKGRMKCLRQNKPIKYYRDNDKDEKAEEIGELHTGIIGANFHGVDYAENSTKISTQINGWSWACQVCNVMADYNKIISLTYPKKQAVSYALLKEFSV